MSNELPPETARRLMALTKCPVADLYDHQNAITAEDLAVLEACIPDPALHNVTITPDDIESSGCGWDSVGWPSLCQAVAEHGFGTYDHYERAGWVKREEAEPEEWGPWVKLAKTGERPDVEFGEGEVVECCWDMAGDNKYQIETHNPDPVLDSRAWATATHYRRKRIRCVFKRLNSSGFHVLWGEGPGESGSTRTPGHYALRGTTWTPATTPELNAAKAGRDPNGVIAWHGGECPVEAHDCITVHYRNGCAPESGYTAGNYEWDHGGLPSDIIAYEVTA